jgi:gliding motility-associated-like protein
MNTATEDYKWFIVGTNQELPKYSWYKPETSTQLVAISVSHPACSSNVYNIDVRQTLWVMGDLEFCEEYGGREVQLQCLPSEATWYRESESHWEYIGVGMPFVTIENNTHNVFVAVYDDGICSVEKRVQIYSGPPKFDVFSPDTTICEGESVLLTVDIDPHYKDDLIWTVKGSTTPINPLVTPTRTTTYRVSIDNVCKEVFKEFTVFVEEKPQLRIMNNPEQCMHSEVYLSSSPNASWWTYDDERITDLPPVVTIDTRTIITVDSSIFIMDGDTIVLYDTIETIVGQTYVAWYRSPSGVCLVSESITFIPEVTEHFFDMVEGDTVSLGAAISLWSTPVAATWYLLPDNIPIGSGNMTVVPIDTGTWSYVAEITNSCGTVRDTVHFYVKIVLDPFDIILHLDSSCYNEGWAEITVIGLTCPFEIVWSIDPENSITIPCIFREGEAPDNGDESKSGKGTSAITELLPGTYWVRVTDVNGLVRTDTFIIGESFPITILESSITTEPPRDQRCARGRITINPTGGTPPYYAIWSDGVEGFDLTDRRDVTAGIYRVQVYDSKGCHQFDTTEIILPCLYTRPKANLFITPNNDGRNDYLKIKDIQYYPINRVIIFNAYGEIIFQMRNYDNTKPDKRWDGLRNGKPIPDGVYYYIMEAEDAESSGGWILMKASHHR